MYVLLHLHLAYQPLVASFTVQNPLEVFLYQLLGIQPCLAQAQQVYVEKAMEILTEEQRKTKALE